MTGYFWKNRLKKSFFPKIYFKVIGIFVVNLDVKTKERAKAGKGGQGLAKVGRDGQKSQQRRGKGVGKMKINEMPQKMNVKQMIIENGVAKCLNKNTVEKMTHHNRTVEKVNCSQKTARQNNSF